MVKYNNMKYLDSNIKIKIRELFMFYIYYTIYNIMKINNIKKQNKNTSSLMKNFE